MAVKKKLVRKRKDVKETQPSKTELDKQFLAELCKDMNAVMGVGDAVFPLDGVAHGGPVLSTGLYELDCILAQRGKDISEGDDLEEFGMPMHTLIQITGMFQCGKSALAQLMTGRFQRKYQSGLVYYIDVEAALARSHQNCYGVDPNRYMYSDLMYVEDVLKFIAKTMKSHRKGGACYGREALIVWDSIAQTELLPKQKDKKRKRTSYDDEAGDDNVEMAAMARVLSRKLKKIPKLLQKSKTTLICINQLRASMNAYGPGKVRVGGNALDFSCSMILELANTGRQDKTVKGQKIVYGQDTRVQTKKNRFLSPFQEANFLLSFEHGPSISGTAWEVLEDNKKLERIPANKKKGIEKDTYSIVATDTELDGLTFVKHEWLDFHCKNEQLIYNIQIKCNA